MGTATKDEWGPWTDVSTEQEWGPWEDVGTPVPPQDVDVLEAYRLARETGADPQEVLRMARGGEPAPNVVPENVAARGIRGVPVIGDIIQGVELGGAQIASGLSRLTGLGDADRMQGQIAQYRQQAAEANPGLVSQGVRTIGEGLTVGAPLAPLGGVPAIAGGAAIYGGTAADRAIAEGRERGLSDDELARYVATQGAVGAVAGAVPMGFLGRGAARTIGAGALSEGVASGADIAARTAFDVNAPETWGDIATEVAMGAAMGGAFPIPALASKRIQKMRADGKEAEAKAALARELKKSEEAAAAAQAAIDAVYKPDAMGNILGIPRDANIGGLPPTGGGTPDVNARLGQGPAWQQPNNTPNALGLGVLGGPTEFTGGPQFVAPNRTPNAIGLGVTGGPTEFTGGQTMPVPRAEPIRLGVTGAPDVGALGGGGTPEQNIRLGIGPPMPRVEALPPEVITKVAEVVEQSGGNPLTTAQVKEAVGGTRESVRAVRDELNAAIAAQKAAQPVAEQPAIAPQPAPTPAVGRQPGGMQRFTPQEQPGQRMMRRPVQQQEGGDPNAVRIEEGQGRAEEVAQGVPMNPWDTRKENWPESVELMSPQEYLALTGNKTTGKPWSNETISDIQSAMSAGEKINPVSIRIDADTGKVIEQEGNHRAIAAQQSGLNQIPVYVSVWKDGKTPVDPSGYAREGDRYAPVEQAGVAEVAPAVPAPSPQAAPTETTPTVRYSKPEVGVQRATLGDESLDILKMKQGGYEVRTLSGKEAGTYPTLKDAKKFVSEELETNYRAKQGPDLYDPESGAVDFGAISQVPAAATKAVGRTLKRYLDSRKGMPEDAFQAKVIRDGTKVAVEAEANILSKDTERAMRADGFTDDLAIGQYLKGDNTINLPPQTRAAADKQRAFLDQWTQKAIDEGVVKGEMAVTFRHNMGSWVRRSYRIFDEGEEYLKRVMADPTIWNPAVDAAARMLGVDRATAEGELAALFQSYADRSNGGKFGQNESIIGAKDISSLIRRKDIPAEIRRAMGEYTDPKINFAKSAQTLADLVVNHQFLKEVERSGLHAGWLVKDPTLEMRSPIAAQGNRRMEPLAGLYTTPEIAEAFRDVYSSGPSDSTALRTYRKFNSFSRAAATTLNWAGHMRNFMAGPALYATGGYARPRDLVSGKVFEDAAAAAAVVGRNPAESIKYAMKRFGMEADADKISAIRKEQQRLMKLGLLDSDITVNQLRDNFKDAMASEMPSGPAGRAFQKAMNTAGAVYQSGDNFWKVMAFYGAKRQYADWAASKGMSDADLDTYVSKMVLDQMPTYSRLGRLMRAAKDLPVRPDFIAWPAEIVRTSANIIARTAEEFNSGDPFLRKIALNRFFQASAALAAPAAFQLVSAWENDMTEEKQEALRRFLPPWMQHSNVVHLPQRDGTYRVVDLAFSDPYDVLRSPFNAILAGEDWRDSFAQGIGFMLGEYVDPGILTGALIDWARNTTEDGGRVYNKGDDWQNKLIDSLKHVGYRAFTPGTLKGATRIYKGATGISDRGRTYNVQDEAMANVLGLRVNAVDIPRSMMFRAKDTKEALNNQTTLYTDRVNNRGIDPAQALADMDEARKRIMQEMHEDYKAALLLGASERSLIESMKEGNMSREDIAQVRSGRFRDARPPRPQR